MKVSIKSLTGVAAVLFRNGDTLVHVETFIGKVSTEGCPFRRVPTRKFQYTSHESVGEIEYEVVA